MCAWAHFWEDDPLWPKDFKFTRDIIMIKNTFNFKDYNQTWLSIYCAWAHLGRNGDLSWVEDNIYLYCAWAHLGRDVYLCWAGLYLWKEIVLVESEPITDTTNKHVGRNMQLLLAQPTVNVNVFIRLELSY